MMSLLHLSLVPSKASFGSGASPYPAVKEELASIDDKVLHLFTPAYDLLRDSGVIRLPSQRILRDYSQLCQS